MIILGIDPGLRIAGFSVIKKDLRGTLLLDYGYLSLPATKTLSQRVRIFHDFFEQKIQTFQATDVAIETPFLGKNAQNFLKLGYVRGIIYLLVDRYQLKLHEFSPREVKQAVTGFGGASKEQVARALAQLFPQLPPQKKEDVTDALAVTLCGLWRQPRLQV
jgi:crossover junction endodeoxyribonuclease RuvC